MNTIFLHVGPHKTGTTALQKFMLDNQANLFKQNLVYPKRYVQIFGHHKFRDNIVNREITKDDVAFFKETDNNFLLSSEDYISLSKEDFEYFKQCFEGFEIKVIYTWRRASLKLFSIWQEVIKHGGTIDFFQYYHEHLARPGTSQMLSPDLKVGMFSQVFGINNVSVLDYESSVGRDTLINDFLSLLDIKWDDSFAISEQSAESTNKSMTLADVEIVRALNILAKQAGILDGGNIRLAYLKHKDTLVLDSLVELIREHTVQINVGNYFIDVRSEKVMSDKYGAHVYNYQNAVKRKEIQIASSEWFLSSNVQSLLNDIVQTLAISDAQ